MINLPKDLEQAAERHLASGRYSSVEDVLRAALNHLDTLDLESLQHSLNDESAGRMVPLHEAASRIREKHGFASPE